MPGAEVRLLPSIPRLLHAMRQEPGCMVEKCSGPKRFFLIANAPPRALARGGGALAVTANKAPDAVLDLLRRSAACRRKPHRLQLLAEGEDTVRTGMVSANMSE